MRPALSMTPDYTPTPEQRRVVIDAIRLAAECGVTVPRGAALISWWRRREDHECAAFTVTGGQVVEVWFSHGLAGECLVEAAAHELQHVADALAHRDDFPDRLVRERRAEEFAARVVARWRGKQMQPTTNPASPAGRSQ